MKLDRFFITQIDHTCTQEDMKKYGYKWTGMLPIKDVALAKLVYNTTASLYALHYDNTESLVEDSTDIDKWTGLFGVEEEEWRAYIINELERSNFDIFGKVYAEQNATDYTGRIIIIRPEWFIPLDWDNFIPEKQLFLAQSGEGCNPKEYGGAINGILLYNREETTITSDNILGAMREEHIPIWAREAYKDIITESNDEESAYDEFDIEM